MAKTNNTKTVEDNSPASIPSTQSGKIWEKIKDIDLELFALPDQTVEKCSDPIFDMSPTDLHLVLHSQAALPQLEEKLLKVKWGTSDRLVVDVKAKFAVVSVQPK